MLSSVHAEQPEDTCQWWSKTDKHYVAVTWHVLHIIQFLEFRMMVAQAYLSKCGTNVEDAQEENAHILQQGNKHQVTLVPPHDFC